MKFAVTDGQAKLLLQHAVQLASTETVHGSAAFAAGRASSTLAALLGVKKITFDMSEFGILAARFDTGELPVTDAL